MNTMMIVGFVLIWIGLALIRLFLPYTGWLTEDGIRVFKPSIFTIQILSIIIYLWINWHHHSKTTKGGREQ